MENGGEKKGKGEKKNGYGGIIEKGSQSLNEWECLHQWEWLFKRFSFDDGIRDGGRSVLLWNAALIFISF